MTPATHTTFAERTGRMLARLWSGFVRLDRKACGWLVAQGLPAGLAKTILWVVKLAVLGVLLLSTQGGDIDKIVSAERQAILRIFAVAAVVTMLLSVLLASTIATPLRSALPPATTAAAA